MTRNETSRSYVRWNTDFVEPDKNMPEALRRYRKWRFGTATVDAIDEIDLDHARAEADEAMELVHGEMQ